MVSRSLDALVRPALGLVLPSILLIPTLYLQVYSLVVMLPKTPLKERISLPCEQLWDTAGSRGGGGSVWAIVAWRWRGVGGR